MQLISSLLVNWLGCSEKLLFQLCPAACSAATLVGLFPVSAQQEAGGGAVAGQVLGCVVSCLRFSWGLMTLLDLSLSSKIL